MTLQENPPWQPNLSSPNPQLGAIHIVQTPDQEPPQECCQTKSNHDPHLSQNLPISPILALTDQFLIGRHAPLMQQFVLNLTPLQPRPQIQLHHIHATRQYNSRQDGVRILMKGRVLQVVIIQRDEDGEGEQEEGEVEGEEAGARVGKGGVAHEACSVDHGKLIDELHGVLERRVEEEAPRSDEKVAHEADEEDGVVAVAAAGLDAQVGVVDEEEIGERVDYLGGVRGRVVIL